MVAEEWCGSQKFAIKITHDHFKVQCLTLGNLTKLDVCIYMYMYIQVYVYTNIWVSSSTFSYGEASQCT